MIRYFRFLRSLRSLVRLNHSDALTAPRATFLPPLPPKVLPLYFPRNKAEQYRAVPLLPKDVGNESGETVVAERQVRVGESYLGASTGAPGVPALTGYEHDEWLEPEQDPTALAGGDEAGVGGVELARYLQLLEASKEVDLRAIEDRKIIYRAGKDSTGLPVSVYYTHQSLPLTVAIES